MKKALVLTVAPAVVALALVASSGAQEAATLHLVSKQVSEAGSGGRPRPGATGVFVNREGGDDTGRSYVQCTLVNRSHGLCLGRFNLSRGTISVQTALPLEDTPDKFKLDITGGTGAYDGARGTATFTDLGKDRTDEVFTFKP